MKTYEEYSTIEDMLYEYTQTRIHTAGEIDAVCYELEIWSNQELTGAPYEVDVKPIVEKSQTRSFLFDGVNSTEMPAGRCWISGFTVTDKTMPGWVARIPGSIVNLGQKYRPSYVEILNPEGVSVCEFLPSEWGDAIKTAGDMLRFAGSIAKSKEGVLS